MKKNKGGVSLAGWQMYEEEQSKVQAILTISRHSANIPNINHRVD
jgi:hypothetical protein